MIKEDESMALFPEIFTSTRKLTDEQFGALIRAGRLYQTEKTPYQGDDVAVDIAFQFLANQIDRRNEASTKRTAAAKKRWDKKEECKPMQSDAEGCTAMQEVCKPMQSDAPIHSVPIHSIPIHSDKESMAAEPPAPTKEAKKAFGEYGWVKLTDSEYNRLLNDLGEAEVKRCIAYVDQSAQTTGNKNKWRDWNLVVRKCHKQGWGINCQQYSRKPEIPKGSGELGSAELDAIRRVLAQPEEQFGEECPYV